MPRSLIFRWVGSWLFLAALVGAAAGRLAADVTPEKEQAFTTTIAPLLKKYCYECHQGDSAENGVRLDQVRTAAEAFASRPIWLRVLAQARAQTMPPADEPQPSAAERKTLVAWLDGTLNDLDCSQPVPAGHVTMRRLNRAEYRNTIRDLMGVDYAPAADFPADDVGYGFDNIGDVLTLPTILLEKYLEAAEEITGNAIVTQFGPQVVYSRFASQLRGDGEKLGAFEGPRILASDGEMTGRFRLSKGGKFEFRVTAYEHHAGPEAAKMVVRVDGKDIATVEVTATEGAPQVYKIPFSAESGERRFGLAFVNDYYRPEDPDPKNRDRNLIVTQVEVVGPVDSRDALPASHRQIVFATPGKDLSPEAASKFILERLAGRAFRRPATATEVERLMRLAASARASGDSFEKSIQFAAQAILVSPQFLFRVEQDPPGNHLWRELNDYELATRLSYFLWSSLPDEELTQIAARGELRSGDHLERQVRRMLADDKSAALMENFAGQWLQLRKFQEVNVSRRHFPAFNPQLRADMREETLRFFTHLFREDRSLVELLSADYSFLNERLAKHYEISGVQGNEFRRVSLAGSVRRGILSHGSFLTVTSNPTRTSPVKRGKWILENLLGEPPPPPPPNAPLLEEQEGDALTGSLKQRMEQHRKNPNCAVCHKQMDVLGFSLENYDAVGAWRTKEGRFEIDVQGELPSGEKVSSPRELTDLLVASKRDQFVRCVSEKMLIYALGRGLEFHDKCAVDKIIEALRRNDFRCSTLVLEIARSEPFQRQGAKRVP